MLSPAIQKYLLVLNHPFADGALGTNIPDSFSLPSFKFSVRMNGRFRAGSNSTGGVGFYPFRMLFSDYNNAGTTTCNTPFTGTMEAYAGTDHAYLNSGVSNQLSPTTTIAATLNDSPFTMSQFGASSGRSARFVGGGIRVTSLEAALTRKGTYTVWRNPAATAQIDAAADTLGDLLAIRSSRVVGIADSPIVEISYVPVSPVDFNSFPTPGVPGLWANDHPMSRLACGVAVDDANAGAAFVVEAIAHFEVYGRSLVKTPSISDVQGLGAVFSSVASSPVQTSFAAAHSEALRSTVNAVARMQPSGSPQVFQRAAPRQPAAPQKSVALEVGKALGAALLSEGKKRAKKKGVEWIKKQAVGMITNQAMGQASRALVRK